MLLCSEYHKKLKDLLTFFFSLNTILSDMFIADVFYLFLYPCSKYFKNKLGGGL